MFRRAIRVRRQGFKKYSGTTEEICHQIIKDSFGGECFHASSGHFTQFWVRDFAFSCEAFVKLGYKNEVKKSLTYVMEQFVKHNRIAQVVTKDNVFDFPCYGPDALALFLYALTHTGNEALAKKHKLFLQEQLNIFAKKVIHNGLPKRNKRFSSIRDQVKHDASCYDMVMIAIAAREAKKLDLTFPYSFAQTKEFLKEHYWNGIYFFSDLKKQNIVVGDANVFPFWAKIFTEKSMITSAFNSIHAANLDDPFPLQYVNSVEAKCEKINMHYSSWLAKDYETDSLWIHLGLAYLKVLLTTNKKRAKKHLETYKNNIETYKTFLEVFDKNGIPFERTFYITDEAMSWCSNYLVLTKEAEK